MVTKSNIDYQKHKEDIHYILNSRYGEKMAEKFIRFYSDRYDDFGRSFIDYKLAIWLMDDYAYVRKIGTRWYACVGVGGTGKTTIMKNIMYFLDKTFTLKDLSLNIDGFIKSIHEASRINSMKAALMDEPDDAIVSNSKEGKKLRQIFGKVRQQKCFLGICATDLNDIPPYIFRKLDGIIFCPCLGKAMFFKNRPHKGSYILQKIRREYAIKGYKVFFELRKDAGCITFDTCNTSPLDLTEGKEYLDKKENDFDRDIKDFLTMRSNNEQKAKKSEREIIIQNMKDKGLTDEKIGELIGLSRSRVTQILNENKNLTEQDSEKCQIDTQNDSIPSV